MMGEPISQIYTGYGAKFTGRNTFAIDIALLKQLRFYFRLLSEQRNK